MTKRGRGKQRTEPGEKGNRDRGKLITGTWESRKAESRGKIENKIKTSVDKNEKIN